MYSTKTTFKGCLESRHYVFSAQIDHAVNKDVSQVYCLNR